MTKLRIYDDQKPEAPIQQTSKSAEIAAILKTIGVRFEQWKTRYLPKGATNEEIMKAYEIEVAKLVEENGYQSIDIARITPDSPNKEAARSKFFNEHTHTEDEVRLFVEGSGLFYLHVENKIYIVLCEAGDLISIPPNYKHWFDMSKDPHFTAIRFFLGPDGWVPEFTQSGLSCRFPEYVK